SGQRDRLGYLITLRSSNQPRLYESPVVLRWNRSFQPNLLSKQWHYSGNVQCQHYGYERSAGPSGPDERNGPAVECRRQPRFFGQAGAIPEVPGDRNPDTHGRGLGTLLMRQWNRRARRGSTVYRGGPESAPVLLRNSRLPYD